MIPQIIGLKGRVGAGKSAAAEYLIAQYSYRLLKFASPLKNMLRAIGLTEDEVEGHLKETPCPRLSGATRRHAMQSLGTSWGRDHIHPDFWVRLWAQEAASLFAAPGIVVDDVRFPNEAAAVRDLGGVVIEIRRECGFSVAADHASETQDFPADFRIINEGFDKSILHARLEGALEYIGRVQNDG